MGADPVARDPRHDILFESVAVGPKVLKNRFFQSAHCMGAGSERPGFQAAFRATKAEGGWAAVSTEYCAVAPDSDDCDRVSARLWDDDDLAALAAMADAVHEHGALAAIELWHGGPTAKCLESRLPQLAPSPMATISGLVGTGCKTMDLDDIRRVVADFESATVRAREAGFDIVTVHVTHAGSLPHLFLLPQYNRRDDAYGGSFENRSRLAREILAAVNDGADGACAIAARFGLDTLDRPQGLGDGGIRATGDGGRFIELCDDLVDMWDLTVGSTEWGEDAGPSRTHPENHEWPWVQHARSHTAKPIMTVGRFTNPDTMSRLVESGRVDIIGAARPSIADPFLPRKIEEGRIDEIRECIGCNVCVSRWELGGPQISCTQNATSGEEFRRGWHPEKFARAANADKDVVVVGAGPAGMECAIVLAKRGMRRVHLVDAAAQVGGCMRWIPRLPGLGEWARVVSYRQVQIAKLRSLELIASTRLDADTVLDYGAEIVVVATGAAWLGDGWSTTTFDAVDGADSGLPHVLTPEQVMLEEKAPPPGPVVVYDCDGYFVGAGLAERFARDGRAVTYVAPFEGAAPYTHYTLERPRILRRLDDLGVRLVGRHVVSAVSATTAVAADVIGGRELELECAGLLLVTERRPDDALYRALKANPDGMADAGIEAVYRVGDCVAPRIPADAIFDGHRLAREIDSGDPERPLPFRRERGLPLARIA
jgi:dimethylamine/trimethylamine dehydrogenase